MAGHSHWASIKHKKAIVDKRRGLLWSKLVRNIIVAARLGGGNPEANIRLREAIEKAKDANVPRDTIERAIKRGTGELAGEANYEEIVYEGYGPGGVAIMCRVLTDNRNRTAPEIRKIFERHGGNLGTSNSVAWLFKRVGLFTVPADEVDEDKVLEAALEAGAEDVKREGNLWQITCAPEDFMQVKEQLQQAEIPLDVAEVSMLPNTTVTVDAETGRKVLRLIEELEDHEDVQNVYSNFEMPEEILAEIGAEQ